jgi:hypothetical protein
MGTIGKVSVALSDDELLVGQDRMKGMLDKKDFDHRAIFFGSQGEDGYPRWFGYSFGCALVSAGLEYTGRTAADAARSADCACRFPANPPIFRGVILHLIYATKKPL